MKRQKSSGTMLLFCSEGEAGLGFGTMQGNVGSLWARVGHHPLSWTPGWTPSQSGNRELRTTFPHCRVLTALSPLPLENKTLFSGKELLTDSDKRAFVIVMNIVEDDVGHGPHAQSSLCLSFTKKIWKSGGEQTELCE